MAIERRKLEPLIYIRCGGLVGQRTREVFEQHGLDAAETPALGGDPGIEHRAACDLEALEQLTREMRRELFLAVHAQLLDAVFRSAGHFERVHPAVREVDSNRAAVGDDPLVSLVVDEPADLRQAPS